MMLISTENTVVFHSGRRRYLTLSAACRDAARQKVFRAVYESGDDLNSSQDWWQPRVARLARLYVRWFKLSRDRDEVSK